MYVTTSWLFSLLMWQTWVLDTVEATILSFRIDGGNPQITCSNGGTCQPYINFEDKGNGQYEVNGGTGTVSCDNSACTCSEGACASGSDGNFVINGGQGTITCPDASAKCTAKINFTDQGNGVYKISGGTGTVECPDDCNCKCCAGYEDAHNTCKDTSSGSNPIRWTINGGTPELRCFFDNDKCTPDEEARNNFEDQGNQLYKVQGGTGHVVCDNGCECYGCADSCAVDPSNTDQCLLGSNVGAANNQTTSAGFCIGAMAVVPSLVVMASVIAT